MTRANNIRCLEKIRSERDCLDILLNVTDLTIDEIATENTRGTRPSILCRKSNNKVVEIIKISLEQTII